MLVTSPCEVLRGFCHSNTHVCCTIESVRSNSRAPRWKALVTRMLAELVKMRFRGVTSALLPVEGDLGFGPSPPSFRAHAPDGHSEDRSGEPSKRRMWPHFVVSGNVRWFPTFIRGQAGTWRNRKAPQDARFSRGDGTRGQLCTGNPMRLSVCPCGQCARSYAH